MITPAAWRPAWRRLYESTCAPRVVSKEELRVISDACARLPEAGSREASRACELFSAPLVLTADVGAVVAVPAPSSTPVWWRAGSTAIEFAVRAGVPPAPVTALTATAPPGYPGTPCRVYTLSNLVVLTAGSGANTIAVAFPTLSVTTNYVMRFYLPSLEFDDRTITPWIVTDARIGSFGVHWRRRLLITVEFYWPALAEFPGANPEVGSSYSNQLAEIIRFRRDYSSLVRRLAGGTAARPALLKGGDGEIIPQVYGYCRQKAVVLIISASACTCVVTPCGCRA